MTLLIVVCRTRDTDSNARVEGSRECIGLQFGIGFLRKIAVKLVIDIVQRRAPGSFDSGERVCVTAWIWATGVADELVRFLSEIGECLVFVSGLRGSKP
jgi:hypothetical protein